MKIACLGWGSLIWKPESLLIRREWFEDGPFLPIEFVRQSNDGRLTLVITKSAKPIRTLWALMATTDLEMAKKSLSIREGIAEKNIVNLIGCVKSDEIITNDDVKVAIREWALNLKIDAVIWTNLPPKFNEKNHNEPSLVEAVEYLNNLDINKKATAEEYIRRAPKQIDTDYRRKFESEFGWTYKISDTKLILRQEFGDLNHFYYELKKVGNK
jgi:hypothetical protein